MGMLGVISSTVASLVAGVLSLWLLNRILGKDMFGGYAFAMSIVLLLSIVGTIGLDRVLLLRVAGLSAGDGVLRGKGLALRAGATAAAAAILLAAAMWIGADILSTHPEDQFWLHALAPAVLPFTLVYLAQAWFQANHRVAEAVVLPGLSDLARAALVALVWMTSGGAVAVAVAVTVSAFLPVAVIAGKTLLAGAGAKPKATRRMPRRLRLRDLGHGGYYLVQNLSVRVPRLADVMVVGFVASAAMTADYAVAARLAAMGELGFIALRPTFTPRARRHLLGGDLAAIAHEFRALRLGGLLVALAVAAGFALLGHLLLAAFGPYEEAYGALLVLSAAYVVLAGAGMQTAYLSMTGDLRAAAAVQAATVLCLIAALAGLAPSFGPLGAAFGMLATQILSSILLGVVLKLRTGFISQSLQTAVMLCACVATLVLGALDILPPLGTTGILLALGGLSVLTERHVARDLVALLWRKPA